MEKDIKELLWPHENSVYLVSYGFGFMRISWSIFELECFEKMFPKIKISALLEIVNFQDYFDFLKNAQVQQAVTAKLFKVHYSLWDRRKAT